MHFFRNLDGISLKLATGIAFFLLFFISQAYAQPREIRTRTGYHPESGTLKLKYEYYHDYWSEQDMIHGRYSEWNTRGTLVIDCYYKEGLRDSICKLYWPNGELQEVSWWVAGKKHGMLQMYDKKGLLIKELRYVEDQPQGIVYEYYPNGRPKSVGTYANGLRDGLFTFYKPNGNLKKTRNYEMGKAVKMEDPNPTSALNPTQSNGK